VRRALTAHVNSLSRDGPWSRAFAGPLQRLFLRRSPAAARSVICSVSAGNGPARVQFSCRYRTRKLVF
jgi:hypothetical protein